MKSAASSADSRQVEIEDKLSGARLQVAAAQRSLWRAEANSDSIKTKEHQAALCIAVIAWEALAKQASTQGVDVEMYSLDGWINRVLNEQEWYLLLSLSDQFPRPLKRGRGSVGRSAI
jgi:hypothetical protein